MPPMPIDHEEKSLSEQQQNYISENFKQDDPYESFLYALKSSETKRRGV